ncbi:MAG: tetratricopeptide repeat protein [bacterium]
MKKLIKKLLIIFLVVWALAAFAVRAESSESAFRFPVRAYNDGNYRVAIQGFEDFVDQFPDHERVPHALFWTGEAHRHLGRTEKAYEIFNKLRRRAPDFQPERVLPRIAYLAEKLDRQEEIMKEITERMLQEVPELQDYLIRWRVNREEKSELASQLSALPPGSLTPTAADFVKHYDRETTLVQLQEKLNSGSWSASIFKQMRGLPEVTRKNLVLAGGRKLFEADEMEQLVDFGTSVPSKWQPPGFLLLYGEAALQEGDLQLAEDLYRDLLQSPDYREEAYFNLAWLLNEQNKKSEALNLLNEIQWQGETELNARAFRLKADILLEKNQPSDAIEFYRRATEVAQDPAFRNETRYWLGWSYLEVDMIRQAYDIFNSVRAAGPIRLEDIYQVRGRTALELGKYEEAEHNYRRALDHAVSDDSTVKLRYELAQTYYEGGKLEKAYDLLLQLHEQDLPKRLRSPVKLSLGRAAVEMGKPDLGWSVLRSAEDELVAEFPEEFRYFAGEAALESGQVDRALAYFEELAQKYPESRFVRPALRMGFRAELSRLNAEERNDEENIRGIIEQSPDDLRLLMLQEWARAEKNQKNYDRARKLYEEIMENTEDPGQIGLAVAGIIEIDLQQETPERASEFLELQLQELPEHPRVAGAVYRLINYYYNQRRLEDVKKWSDRYLAKFKTSPDHPRINFILAEIARRENDLKGARANYSRVLEKAESPDLKSRARFRLGELDFQAGNYEKAYNKFKQVFEARPTFITEARLNGLLAESALNFENYRLAKKHLDRIESLEDEQLIFLSRVHFHRDNFEQAGEVLEKLELEEDSPLRPDKMFWKGRVARQRENYEEAENIWYRQLYLYPEWENRDELIFYLADLLRNRGKEEEAESLREKLSSEYPESEYLEAF